MLPTRVRLVQCNQNCIYFCSGDHCVHWILEKIIENQFILHLVPNYHVSLVYNVLNATYLPIILVVFLIQTPQFG